MKIDVITIFPNFFDSFLNTSIIKRAIEKKLVEVNIVDLRQYTDLKHNQIDDTPYGGGSGMLMMFPPFHKAVTELRGDNSLVILLSPQGKIFNQTFATNLVKEHNHIIILCGHYEGVDERVLSLVDLELSLGDFITTGGEVVSTVIIDTITRVTPGVINEENVLNESIQTGLLKYPQYTRPVEYMGLVVPDVLMSGHHKNIEKWRMKESLEKTLIHRPDLIEEKKLSNEEKKVLLEIKKTINEKSKENGNIGEWKKMAKAKGQQLIQEITQPYLKDVPNFGPGDNVKVHVMIREGNRERIQLFEGLVIKRQNGGIDSTFTVRKVSYGVGVERTFTLHSPQIEKIEVTRRGLVRRAKLNYIRNLSARAARIKERR